MIIRKIVLVSCIVYTLAFSFCNAFMERVGNFVRNNKTIATLVVGGTAAIAARKAYTTNEKVKAYVNNLSEKIAHTALEHVVLPLLLKWEDCKDALQYYKKEGFTYADLAAIAAFSGTCYGLKKLDDKVELLDQGARAANYIVTHKANTALALAGVGSCVALWRLIKAIGEDKKYEIDAIDSFLSALTDDQRSQIMQSPELLALIAQGYSNPACLAENTEFLSLLTEKQKSHLAKIVSSYEQKDRSIKLAYES